jgi:hypothetical protein
LIFLLLLRLNSYKILITFCATPWRGAGSTSNSFKKGELSRFRIKIRPKTTQSTVGVITLLVKKENVVQIQQYRHICLLNVSFKIFTKVATNRIIEIAENVVRPTQSAFMPGRHVFEGVVVLHETIHELQSKKWMVFFFKLILRRLMIKSNDPFCNKLCA